MYTSAVKVAGSSTGRQADTNHVVIPDCTQYRIVHIVHSAE